MLTIKKLNKAIVSCCDFLCSLFIVIMPVYTCHNPIHNSSPSVYLVMIDIGMSVCMCLCVRVKSVCSMSIYFETAAMISCKNVIEIHDTPSSI